MLVGRDTTHTNMYVSLDVEYDFTTALLLSMHVRMKRLPNFGQTGKGPTISVAILDHGSDMSGTEIIGAGGIVFPLPSR